IAEGGYIPMVYFNRKTGLMKFDLNVLSGFDLWLAEYKDEPVFPYRFALWQYSDEGHIDGIEGDVDLDICFEDYPNIRR
ncbi:MAG: glycoside hydrolase, partial [Oscillospiraceae bacterium]|nr:glycoside hydrolase [Oscillospiraceae bacterium]